VPQVFFVPVHDFVFVRSTKRWAVEYQEGTLRKVGSQALRFRVFSAFFVDFHAVECFLPFLAETAKSIFDPALMGNGPENAGE